MMPIQKIAKATGISVRTLRYYEEIGLLLPVGKTEGGHRLYGDEELKKLQQIMFMKTMGFALKEIRNLIAEKWDWEDSLDHQLAFVLAEQAKLKQMEQAIRSVKHSMLIEGELSESLLQMMIKMSNQDRARREEIWQNAFIDEEKELIEALPKLGGNDSHSLEWVALLGQMKMLIADEAEPGGKPVQRIIKRIMEKAEEEFQGNEEFMEKFWEIRKSPEQSEQAGLYPLDEVFLDFFETAFAIYEKEG